MLSFTDAQVINGSHGEAWIDEDYMAEVVSLEAKVTLGYSDVNRVGTLAKGRKLTSTEGKGTVKMNKVRSYFINLLSANTKAGIQTSVTIISKLKDPNALGAERIAFKGCTFDEVTLANWEAKKLGEESVAFAFNDWELLDVIDA